MSKFLDYTGLSYFLDKLKGFFVTLSTDQNITGTKTFIGQKKIQFKQSASNDKLGFTLYNNNGVEKGYLEYNPSNTLDGAPLMTLGNYASTTSGLTHVGFRKYSNISGSAGAYNLLAPLVASARTPFSLTTTYQTFYLPLGVTDGTTIVKTAATGLLNIQPLIPNASSIVSSYVTSGGYVTSSYVANASVKNADSLGGSAATFYAKTADIPTSSNISSIASSVVTSGGYAVDAEVVHIANAETISGAKTFSKTISALYGVNAANNYKDIVARDGVIASVRTDGSTAEARVRVFSSGANSATDSAIHDLSFRAQTNGNAGIYDNTLGKWLILASANSSVVLYGNASTATNATSLGGSAASVYAKDAELVHISGTEIISGAKTFASGINVSGGLTMATGNIVFNKTATISGSSVNHSCVVTMNDNSLNCGLYDNTHARWAIGISPSGNAFVNAPFSVTNGLTVAGGATVSGGLTVSGGITGTATDASSLGGVAASNYVDTTTSQSIGGQKVFTSSIRNTGASYAIVNQSIVKGTTPSSDMNKYIYFFDKVDDPFATALGADHVMAALRQVYGRTGNNALQLMIYRPTSGGTANKLVSFRATPDGAYEFIPGSNNDINLGGTSNKWATVYATTFSGTATSATNATSLGGSAASTYLNSANFRYGSITAIASGTSVASGAVQSSVINFSALPSVPQAVLLTVRGSAGSLAQQHSACVFSMTKSSCAIRVKNTGAAGSTTSPCYVDYIALA